MLYNSLNLSTFKMTFQLKNTKGNSSNSLKDFSSTWPGRILVHGNWQDALRTLKMSHWKGTLFEFFKYIVCAQSNFVTLSCGLVSFSACFLSIVVRVNCIKDIYFVFSILLNNVHNSVRGLNVRLHWGNRKIILLSFHFL